MPRITPILEVEKAVGRRLNELRKALLISQTAFAVKLEISQPRLAGYESGRAPLPYEIGERIVQIFCVSPLWLALGTGPRWVANGYSFTPSSGYKGTFYDVIGFQLKEGHELRPEIVERELHAIGGAKPPRGPFHSVSHQVAYQVFTDDFLFELFASISPHDLDDFTSELRSAAERIARTYSKRKR